MCYLMNDAIGPTRDGTLGASWEESTYSNTSAWMHQPRSAMEAECGAGVELRPVGRPRRGGAPGLGCRRTQRRRALRLRRAAHDGCRLQRPPDATPPAPRGEAAREGDGGGCAPVAEEGLQGVGDSGEHCEHGIDAKEEPKTDELHSGSGYIAGREDEPDEPQGAENYELHGKPSASGCDELEEMQGPSHYEELHGRSCADGQDELEEPQGGESAGELHGETWTGGTGEPEESQGESYDERSSECSSSGQDAEESLGTESYDEDGDDETDGSESSNGEEGQGWLDVLQRIAAAVREEARASPAGAADDWMAAGLEAVESDIHTESEFEEACEAARLAVQELTHPSGAR